MSMHLENPGLTTAGKKKGKHKYSSSEAKRNAEKLAKEWEELKKKYEPAKIPRKVFKTESLSPAMSTPRQTPTIPSLVTPGGDCLVKESIKYTGTKVIGIATMHKSNPVPVFSNEEAIAVSCMRR